MKAVLPVAMLLIAAETSAADTLSAYSFSASYGDDGAYSLHGAADLGLNDANRLLFDLGYSRSPRALADLATYRGGATYDHDFDPVGVSLGYEYWGDRDRIVSHAVRVSPYLQGDPGRFAILYERRKIRLDFDVPIGARGFVDNSRTAHSNAFGVSGRLNGERVDGYLSGVKYDYDTELGRLGAIVDLSRVPVSQRLAVMERLNSLVFALNRLNASSLTLANSLLDYSAAAGIDMRFGANTLNFEVGRDVAATDDLALNSASIGLVHPLCDRCDIEYRVGGSKGDGIEASFYGGVTFYWYR